MKLRFTLLFTCFALVFLSFPNRHKACNLSHVGPFTVVPGPGSDSTIVFQVCFGGGVTGTTNGADGDTRSIAFAWYDTDTNFVVNSFLPASMTGAATGCTMGGFNYGPFPAAPYNSQGTILYIDPGYYNIPPCNATPFTCITSTVLCGNVSQQCITYSFVVNFIPDSMRVFGVEGGGNAIAGCYPDADMMINFIVLPVEWGPMKAVKKSVGIEVQWATYQETNTDIFIVEREGVNGEFTAIGQVKAAGNSSNLMKYHLTDLNPNHGANRYRIVQVDRGGGSKQSEVLEQNFEQKGAFEILELGPNPCSLFFSASFFCKEGQNVRAALIEINGAVLETQEIQANQGSNQIKFDMATRANGIYFLRLESKEGMIYRKLIKQ